MKKAQIETKIVKKPETDEYIVKTYRDGKYVHGEDYFTNDKDDANQTAKAIKKN